MSELKPRIHDEVNGLDYILAGDYYIPAIELLEDDDRPIGKWGRMHRAYLEEAKAGVESEEASLNSLIDEKKKTIEQVSGSKL